MDAQNFNFSSNLPSISFSASKFAFLDEHFLTEEDFSAIFCQP